MRQGKSGVRNTNQFSSATMTSSAKKSSKSTSQKHLSGGTSGSLLPTPATDMLHDYSLTEKGGGTNRA